MDCTAMRLYSLVIGVKQICFKRPFAYQRWIPALTQCSGEAVSLASNLEKESIMSSTSLERQPLELLPGDLLRPLGAFEELFCLFDQHFPTNHALAAQIIGHATVQRWRDALDVVQQRHPLLSACIDTTFNRVPHFRHVTGQCIPLRVVTSPYARWQREIAEEVNAPFTPDQ